MRYRGKVPVATTLKEALLPTKTAWLAGCCVIVGESAEAFDGSSRNAPRSDAAARLVHFAFMGFLSDGFGSLIQDQGENRSRGLPKNLRILLTSGRTEFCEDRTRAES